MRSYPLYILFFIFLLQACGEEQEEKKETPKLFNLEGYWANIGFIDKARKNGLSRGDFYCTEMTFDKDSVEIDNGFELYKLKYTVNDSICCLQDAFQENDLNLKIGPENYMKFADTSLKAIHGNDFFNRIENGGVRFHGILNDNLIAGKYKMEESGKPVRFNLNGRIEGDVEYTNYELCYSGDCLSEPDTVVNIMRLTHKNGDKDSFAWKRDAKAKTLTIYQLEPATPEIKGQRKIEKVIWKLSEVN